MISPICEDFVFTKLRICICDVSQKLNPRENSDFTVEHVVNHEQHTVQMGKSNLGLHFLFRAVWIFTLFIQETPKQVL